MTPRAQKPKVSKSAIRLDRPVSDTHRSGKASFEQWKGLVTARKEAVPGGQGVPLVEDLLTRPYGGQLDITSIMGHLKLNWLLSFCV